ncbi:30S ribosomal protein S16 [Candidatus Bipolaricaulota bacterium]
MAAKIRLKKVGRRGQPSYRVVVLDGQKPRDAKVVADLGPYDPKTNPATFEIDGDAALEWLLKGAKATRAARIILSKAGVMAAWDAAKRGETVEIEAKELKPTTKPKKKAKADEEAVGADDKTVGSAEEPSTEGAVPVGADGEAVGADEELTTEETTEEATEEAPVAEPAAAVEEAATEETSEEESTADTEPASDAEAEKESDDAEEEETEEDDGEEAGDDEEEEEKKA